MQSRNMGSTFTEPKRISPKDDVFSGFMNFNTKTNVDATQTIVGTYAVSPFDPLRVIYSKDHGKTFEIKKATENNKEFHTWYYHTTSLTINGKASSPKLGMLTQVSDRMVEYGYWDLNSMTVERDSDFPFYDEIKDYGVAIASYKDSDTLYITAVISMMMDDQYDHLFASTKSIPLQQSLPADFV